LAAHEAGGTHAALMPERERQQQQRPALRVIGDNDERPKTLALSDLPLPEAEEIEPLIRRGELLPAFETAPDRLRLAEIAENVDAGDAARSRPRWCFRRPAFDRGSHGHCETCLQGIIYIFRLWPTFTKKCQQRVMTMRPRRGGISRIEGRDVAIRQPIFDEPAAGARLFQRPCVVEGTGGRRRRCHPALRARATAPHRALSAAQIAGNHAQISRSNHPGVEALEIRYRFDGRSLPEGGHADLAKTVCVPDIRRSLQGTDDIGLSGVVATRRPLRRLRADGVSGRPWRGMVARA